MKFPFTFKITIRFHSIKKKKNKGKGKGEALAEEDVIPVVAVFDLDNPSKTQYKEGIQAVSGWFREAQNHVEDAAANLQLGFANTLMYERFIHKKNHIDVLIDKKNVSLLAVKAGDVLIVVAEKADFAAVGNYLMETEGLDPEAFIYYASPAAYPLEYISFGLSLFRDDMDTLLRMDSTTAKIYENVIIFHRIFCFVVVPAISKGWVDMLSELMVSGDVEQLPDSGVDGVDVWKNWGSISDFIRAEGSCKLPDAVGWLDLPTANSLFSMLRPVGLATPRAASNLKNLRGFGTLTPLPSPLPTLVRPSPSASASAGGGESSSSAVSRSPLRAVARAISELKLDPVKLLRKIPK